jgi:hypothetical protein
MLSELQQPEDLIRHEVHRRGHRASGGAFPALVAGPNVHAADRMDLSDQVIA